MILQRYKYNYKVSGDHSNQFVRSQRQIVESSETPIIIRSSLLNVTCRTGTLLIGWDKTAGARALNMRNEDH
jgi:hypothetical protein